MQALSLDAPFVTIKLVHALRLGEQTLKKIDVYKRQDNRIALGNDKFLSFNSCSAKSHIKVEGYV